MIYKFIDNNGSEISVNSLESLQALIDSDTINENTKVKAGLRGKWTTASEIEGLNFIREELKQSTLDQEEDIKSFITKSENSTEKEKEEIEEVKDSVEMKKEEKKTYQEEKKVAQETLEDTNNENFVDTSDYYTEKFNKTDNTNNESGVSFKDSWSICLSKLTDFSGRASRSEFWKFYLSFLTLFILVLFGILVLIIMANPTISDGALDIISYAFSIPAALFTLSATVRRLHDTNKSGWLVLLGIIPFVGLILLIILILPSDEGKNKYGNNPLRK